ncbi:MAG: DNA repair protein RadA [Myxococcota bacterium]
MTVTVLVMRTARLQIVARPRTVFACTECGAQHPRWLGRCTACGAWETLIEEPSGSASETGDLLAGETSRTPVTLDAVEASDAPRLASGIPELDRVLGGGVVPGSVILLGGEPGIGKSTLGLQLAAHLQKQKGPVLYVCGEESPAQVRLRADRLPGVPGDLRLLASSQVEELAGPWRDLRPTLVLVDSIQSVHTERVASAPGSVSQVRESAALLAGLARRSGAALLLVGHVTKEGTLAGPRVLEHLVDVVLAFEGDRGHSFRLLRATKNRFGATHEVGVFTMTDAGLRVVENPSELFLAERRPGTSGSCIVPVLEGTRPMLLEIQALVAPAGYGTARRTCLGIDDGRVALLLAVLDRRTDVDLLSRDVYVNVAGGLRILEPAADLALALALASSRLDVPLPRDVAACGEVGLGGEVRRVGRIDARLREAERLGFRRVLVPEGVPPRDRSEMTLVPVADVAEAVGFLRASTAVHAAL